VGKWSEIWARFHGRGVYPHQLAFLLRLPVRDLVFSRRDLVEALRLDADCAVLEVGPGPGFFSPAVARAVSRGRLELLDVQLPMLRKSRRRIRRAKRSNVGFACGSATRLPYRSDTFDRVFLVAVIGEVSCIEECAGEITRILRPGGLLVVGELPGDPDALPSDASRRCSVRLGFALRRTSLSATGTR
jgi:ubiquinone/menaquinone biosynthesis C-methylase UbiE